MGKAGGVKRLGAVAFLLLFNVALLVRYQRLARRFFRCMGFVPNFAAPVTFTEKVHWRKIFDDDPRFAVLLDKLQAKQFVGNRLPWLDFPQVLWQGEDPREIPFDRLTVPYIVKCNHGCGMNIAVPEPASADRDGIAAKMSGHLAETFGGSVGERSYATIEPKVFVETLIGKGEDYLPTDYKLSVIGGRVAYVVVTASRAALRKIAFYDRDWNRMALAQGDIDSTLELARPESFSRMVAAAEALAVNFDMLRVDFYEDAGEPVFGEFTVYPRSGLLQFDPPTFDEEIGACWDLGASNYLCRPSRRFARLYRSMLVSAGYVAA